MKAFKYTFFVALFYALFGRLALFLALPPGFAAPIWPAAGIALAFVWLYGYRVWPGILLGSFYVNIWTTLDASSTYLFLRSILLALSIGAGAAIQAAFGCYLTKRFIPDGLKLITAKEIGLFFLFGCVIGCAVSPAIGVLSLIVSGTIPLEGSLHNWFTWWIGNALGVFILAPLTFAWNRSMGDLWYRRRAMLTLPLAIVITCVLCIIYYGQRNQDRHLAAILKNDSRNFETALTGKIDEIFTALDSIKGFYKSSQYVDRAEFKSFNKYIVRRIPVIKSVYWVPRVSYEEKEGYIGKAVQDGLGDYHFKEIDDQGNVTPAGERRFYFPVFYIEPEGNDLALGVDMSSEFARNSAIQYAIESGKARISQPVILTQDRDKIIRSILFISPVFKRDGASLSVPERQKYLNGVIMISTRIQSLIQSVLKTAPLDNIRLSIQDITDMENMYYVYHERYEAKEMPLQETLALNVGGRKWKMTFLPQLDFYFAHQTWGLWIIVVVAFMLSGLLNVIFLINTGQAFEIARIVKERTEQLTESKLSVEAQAKQQEKLVFELTQQKSDMEQQREAMLNILEDVEVARQEAERARTDALRSAERIANIIKTANEAFISMDKEGNIIEWNPQAAEIFGWSREEVIGKPLHAIIIPPVHRAAHQEGLKHFLKTREGPVLGKLIEMSALRKNGQEFPVELTISSQDTQGGILFNSFLRDISERKKADIELKQIALNLERSNIDLEQFAYVASHDLQEPLRKIVGFTQLFEKKFEGKIEGKTKEYMNYITDGAKRMQLLIQDLLQYSRIGREELNWTNTDLNEILKEVEEDFELRIKESKAQITVHKLPTLKAHRSFMTRLFLNLISNAIKYNDKEVPKIDISAVRNGKFWEFTVSDNGIGINPKFSNKIFTIFQRLHSSAQYTGTGIGLSVCKKIVERHGGNIWLQDHAGEGAIFKFTIFEDPQAL